MATTHTALPTCEDRRERLLFGLVGSWVPSRCSSPLPPSRCRPLVMFGATRRRQATGVPINASTSVCSAKSKRTDPTVEKCLRLCLTLTRRREEALHLRNLKIRNARKNR